MREHEDREDNEEEQPVVVDLGNPSGKRLPASAEQQAEEDAEPAASVGESKSTEQGEAALGKGAKKDKRRRVLATEVSVRHPTRSHAERQQKRRKLRPRLQEHARVPSQQPAAPANVDSKQVSCHSTRRTSSHQLP